MRARGKGSSPGRVEGSSRAMLATARPSCSTYRIESIGHIIDSDLLLPDKLPSRLRYVDRSPNLQAKVGDADSVVCVDVESSNSTIRQQKSEVDEWLLGASKQRIISPRNVIAIVIIVPWRQNRQVAACKITVCNIITASFYNTILYYNHFQQKPRKETWYIYTVI